MKAIAGRTRVVQGRGWISATDGTWISQLICTSIYIVQHLRSESETATEPLLSGCGRKASGHVGAHAQMEECRVTAFCSPHTGEVCSLSLLLQYYSMCIIAVELSTRSNVKPVGRTSFLVHLPRQCELKRMQVRGQAASLLAALLSECMTL